MRAGDEADFAALATGSARRLFRTAFALCGDEQIAADAVHAGLVSAYTGWQGVRSADDPEAEVRRLVAREVLGVRGTGPEPSDRLLAELPEPDSTDRLDALPVFVPDLDAVRDAARGRVRRRRRVAGLSLAALGIVLGVGVGLGLVSGDQAVPQTGLARLGPFDFRDGVRGYVDPATGTVNLGTQEVPSDLAPGLADTGLVTPHGVVYITPRQEVRLIEESGRQRVLSPAVGRARDGFVPTSAYDVRQDALVWMTRHRDGAAVVTVHGFDTDAVLGRAELTDVGELRLAGADGGVAVVNNRIGVVDWDWLVQPWTTDEDTGDLASFRELASSGEEVVDMRNGTVLMAHARARALEDLRESGFGGARAQSWVFLDAGESELLTLDGFHRLRGTTKLVPTGGARPMQLVVSGAPEQAVYALDSDGSVLVGTRSPDSVSYYDCALGSPWPACRALDLLRTTGEPPRLLGPSVGGVS